MKKFKKILEYFFWNVWKIFTVFLGNFEKMLCSSASFISKPNRSFLQDENENDENDEEMSQTAIDNDSVMEQDSVFCSSAIATANSSGKGRKNVFFQRSDSTLCLGCSPPDPFETPMIQSLPLADQPHLLQPNSRKEDLFGFPKHSGMGGKLHNFF